jgi:hypothetical protein
MGSTANGGCRLSFNRAAVAAPSGGGSGDSHRSAAAAPRGSLRKELIQITSGVGPFLGRGDAPSPS